LSFIYLLSDPPDMDYHEITDKGGVNQNAVIVRRSQLIDELYKGHLPRTIHATDDPSLPTECHSASQK
jgi:feruloyl-CoA synthase